MYEQLSINANYSVLQTHYTCISSTNTKAVYLQSSLRVYDSKKTQEERNEKREERVKSLTTCTVRTKQ